MRTLVELEAEVIGIEKDPETYFKNHTLLSLLAQVHPDKWKGDPKAEQLFKRAVAAHESLTIKKSKLIATGDTSDVIDNGDTLLKISRFSAAKKMLEHEFKVLTVMRANNDFFRELLPNPVAIDVRASQAITKFVHLKGYVTLDKLKDLRGEHMVWIFKRLMDILGYAHSQGYTHGGVLPSNILVFPEDHRVQLIDWKFGGIEEIKKSKKYMDLYPPDAKGSVQTDIYMAARCLQSVGAPPSQMAAFFKSLTYSKLSMCPTDAAGLSDEMKELAFRLYGKPKFVELVVN